MRIVQSILAVVGVLIVFGFAFIGYEVYRRATDPDHPRAIGRDRPAARAAADADAPRSPADAAGRLVLPAGSRIGQMLLLNTRIVYHVTLPDGTEQIHVLDPKSGEAEVVVAAPALSAAPKAP